MDQYSVLGKETPHLLKILVRLYHTSNLLPPAVKSSDLGKSIDESGFLSFLGDFSFSFSSSPPISCLDSVYEVYNNVCTKNNCKI